MCAKFSVSKVGGGRHQPSNTPGQPTDALHPALYFGAGIKICLSIFLVFMSFTTLCIAQNAQRAAGKAKPTAGGDAARGKYIVEGIARCGQCHTPRDGSGNEEQTHALEG